MSARPRVAPSDEDGVRGRPDRGPLWHPFSDMSRPGDREVVIERGDGCWVYDEDGKRYLDASAALWYCNVGHGRAALAEVARAQMERLAGYQTFDVVANRPALDLADRLLDLSPFDPGGAVFFTSGGSDSVDTAAKMARRHWQLEGEPDRLLIISREGGYHGMHAFGTSLAGIEDNGTRWGPLVREVAHIGRHDLKALEGTLIANAGRVAAFIGEPVQGAAGVHPPMPGYWQGVQDLCREHDVLLIADEVVTGFGRVGRWFGCERYGIEPDLVTCAKGLSSGYLPIGAVVASPRLVESLWSDDAGAFRHGYTYSGHPAACAVSLANLEMIEQEGLVERSTEMEAVLSRELGALSSHRTVAEVRVAGMLCGVELSAAAIEDDPAVVERVVEAARERGVLIRNLLGRTVQISPPLVIDATEVEFLAAVLQEVLDGVGG